MFFKEYVEAKISEAYFIFGCFFMIFPYIVVPLFCFFCCGSQFSSTCQEVKESLRSLLQVAMAPFIAIFMTGRNCFLQNDDTDYQVFGLTMGETKENKIFEHLFEAVPQLTLSCVYIANNGGFEHNSLNVVSSIFSAGSIIMGIKASIDAMEE